MSEVEKLIEIINDFFGCDAAYFDVNPYDLATHLINRGVTVPVRCNNCVAWDSKQYDNCQGWCQKVVGYRRGDWFCAAGKEKVTNG